MSVRVAYVSHSLVAERQRLFAEELRAQLEPLGMRLSEVYPMVWGRHRRVGGQFIDGPMNMVQFRWPRELFAAWALPESRPDVVLVQEEAYCASTQEVADFCDAARIPYITFSWENGRSPSFNAQQVLAGAAFNIFGNMEAECLAIESAALVERVPRVIMPQVGVDPGVYRRRETLPEETRDIFFAGRAEDPMKGISILAHAVAASTWTVRSLANLGRYVSAEEMAHFYSGSRVTCTPSRDVAGCAKEQFAPYVNIESLLCETPVVTTDVAAIREWLRDAPAPGVYFAVQGSSQSLREALEAALSARSHGARLRAWAVERFSNEVVARQYVAVIRKVLG